MRQKHLKKFSILAISESTESISEYTLMLQIYAEEKGAKVRQMRLRTGSDRSKRLGELLSRPSTFRPEPFENELKVELRAAEGRRRWYSLRSDYCRCAFAA